MTPEAGGGRLNQEIRELLAGIENFFPDDAPTISSTEDPTSEEVSESDRFTRNRLTHLFFTQHFPKIRDGEESVNQNAQRLALIFPIWKKGTKISVMREDDTSEELLTIMDYSPDFSLKDLVVSCQDHVQKFAIDRDQLPHDGSARKHAVLHLAYWTIMERTSRLAIEYDKQIPKTIDGGGEE